MIDDDLLPRDDFEVLQAGLYVVRRNNPLLNKVLEAKRRAQRFYDNEMAKEVRLV